MRSNINITIQLMRADNGTLLEFLLKAERERSVMTSDELLSAINAKNTDCRVSHVEWMRDTAESVADADVIISMI